MTQFLNRIPGRAYLLIAILIFAASNSVIRKLTELGAQNPIDGRNPISFAQYIGGSIILIGILLNQIGIFRKPAQPTPQPTVSPAKEMDMEVGFKGL